LDPSNVVDLFCGMGGLSYGFSLEGFQVTGFDKWDCAVLSFNHNRIGVAVKMDLLDSLPEIPSDCIIVGGPPCEPWSRLNLNKSKKGSRHPLYGCLFRFFEIVLRNRPILFVMENVQGVLKDVRANIFMEKIKRGYSVEARVISYADYGAATARRRLFVIGVRNDYGVDARSVFEEIPQDKPVRIRDVIWDLRNRGWDDTTDHVWTRVKTVRRYIRYYRTGKYGWYVLSWDRPSPSFGNITRTYVLHPDSFNGGEKRPISVREALRIMGFPDNYSFPKGTAICAKYEMIADTVSPSFSTKLARTIRKIML
jgi:DNA (cytosine-5)-methyltransferase 1